MKVFMSNSKTKSCATPRSVVRTGAETSTRILNNILVGSRNGVWDDRSSREFDATYRKYLLGILNSTNCCFSTYSAELKNAMVSQTFARLFKYLRENPGWARRHVGSFRRLLRVILTQGAAQSVLRKEMPSVMVDDPDEPGKRVRLPREISMDEIVGDQGMLIDSYKARGSRGTIGPRLSRAEEKEYAKANLSIYSLALLTVLNQLSERDGFIIWDSIVNRKRHLEVGAKYGVTGNNVDQIVHRAFKRINDKVMAMRKDLLFADDKDWLPGLKKLWREYEDKNGPVRSMLLERSFAKALDEWEAESAK